MREGDAGRVRVALANLAFPKTPEEAVASAVGAIGQAKRQGASIICFPECYVPGYRGMGTDVRLVDNGFLTSAWKSVADAAREAAVGVILGTERLEGQDRRISALVIGPDGATLGFQDKVQLDPSEEGTYAAGSGRRIFEIRGLRFGISICHEGWRYPETVRWAALQGAQVVFHPHFHNAQPGSHRPSRFADPLNTFHEKAMLCRAAENTCYFVSVNFAGDGSPTTSAVARPDGSLLASHPYGRAGLLVVDLDLAEASRLLARRYKPIQDAAQTTTRQTL